MYKKNKHFRALSRFPVAGGGVFFPQKRPHGADAAEVIRRNNGNMYKNNKVLIFIDNEGKGQQDGYGSSFFRCEAAETSSKVR